ncbi:Uncharacterised protein [Klebsiella pneumoniae]|nr:Uncharacterised protein [Klebsiella pneumoniae]SYN79643.1 Uncharacterised protein [Klebsiella pneumoniae]
MMSLWDALRMNMMISYQELVRTFLSIRYAFLYFFCFFYTVAFQVKSERLKRFTMI